MRGGAITRVEAFGYRSLRKLSRSVRPFQLLVGPNGSGKSTFIDAIAFLCDLQQTSVEGAIYGDHRLDVPMRAPDARHLRWMRRRGKLEIALEALIPEDLREESRGNRFDTCRYEVAVDTSGPPRLTFESLILKTGNSHDHNGGETPPSGEFAKSAMEEEHVGPSNDRQMRLLAVHPDEASFIHRGSRGERTGADWFPPRQGARALLPDYVSECGFPVAPWFLTLLAPLQRISLAGDALRAPNPPSTVPGLGADGGNLANLLHAFKKDDARRYDLWIRHVREALPDIADVRTHERPEDHHRYVVVHYSNGLEAPSWLVSEGTLRLLALTSLAYAPLPPGPCVIEEPENGIHPVALETMIQSLSSAYTRQILLATHSPLLAALVQPRDMLCFKRSPSKGTKVVAGDEHPRLRNWRGDADLGVLLASGVL